MIVDSGDNTGNSNKGDDELNWEEITMIVLGCIAFCISMCGIAIGMTGNGGVAGFSCFLLVLTIIFFCLVFLFGGLIYVYLVLCPIISLAIAVFASSS